MLIGIVLTLYFLSRAVRSMMRTVNDIYHVEVQRGVLRDVLISFGITAGFSGIGRLQLYSGGCGTDDHPHPAAADASAAGGAGFDT